MSPPPADDATPDDLTGDDARRDRPVPHGSVPHDPGAERLACGADSDELLEQVSAGAASDQTEHQAACPYCQATLAEYDRLWAPVRAVAETPVQAPDSVLEEVLTRIRRIAAEPDVGTIPDPTGPTRVAPRVVVVIARETAQDVDGVRVALGRWVGDGSARVVAGLAGQSTAVEVTIVADRGTDLRALGTRIRGEVAARVRDLTGLEPVHVSVVVEDVFDPRDP